MLQVANLAEVDIYVQPKRYAQGNTVNNSDIRKLRSMISFGSQGAFITTGRYRQDAQTIASEPGFPPIGLVSGRQLVDLLVEYWNAIPPEFQARLGLKPGLVLA